MLLRFMKQLIHLNSQIEDLMSALFCQNIFTLEDSFRIFEMNHIGTVTSQELTKIIEEHNIASADQQQLIQMMDDSDDTVIVTA